VKDRAARLGLPSDPAWYQSAVIYEIPIRAFCDSNGDGVGDIPGLISKLDFVKDLGVTAIWVLPFYPSPMRDGGYDIADYTSVNPVFGTLDDFKQLLAEAHARGLRVITELVINHTSKDHPWFERARRSPPGSRERNFYVWSDNAEGYKDARIIFKDFETSNWSWDPVARQYYWHRFYSHQPDLNFDNPEVADAIFGVVDFWMSLGVDGMRLDAVPYLYEREGTNCENLPETHAFLKRLRAHIDAKYSDRMLLAEANQWPEDAASYFGAGDECQMNFHFPLMPRLFMSLELEDRFPIIDILQQTPPLPPGCAWATFLRNHDELTLEMVTDQDRDYMYKFYAEDPTARLNLGIRRRLAPLLKSRQKIELINGLLFSLPGTPVLYYGDEIGMGDNIYLSDRDGVRTPMQWSGDRNAGFSRANPQRLYLPVVTDPEYHYEAVNVEAQAGNSHSLLWFTRRLIAVAKKHKALGRGSIEFLHPDNNKILAYLRLHGDQRVLVVANLSRLPQYVELELGQFDGLVPVEMFSNVRFPPIGKGPYVLTLSPHAFFWFNFTQPPAPSTGDGPARLDAHGGAWQAVLAREGDSEVTAALLRFLSRRRWFRGKARSVKDLRFTERVALGGDSDPHVLALVTVDYVEGPPETYCLALGFYSGAEAAQREHRVPGAVVARLDAVKVEGHAEPVSGCLFDTLATGDAVWRLLETQGSLGAHGGRVSTEAHGALAELLAQAERPPVKTPELEQTNTVVHLGDRVLLKLYRLVEEGSSPEVEVGLALTKAMGDRKLVPALLGGTTFASLRRTNSQLAVAQQLVPNEGDAWKLTLAEIELFFDRVLSQPAIAPPPKAEGRGYLQPQPQPPPELTELVGRYFGLARLLGQRTADVHQLLYKAGDNPAFAPEPFTAQHLQSIYQWSHVNIARTFDLLRKRAPSMNAEVRQLINEVVAGEKTLDGLMRRMVGRRIDAQRIRVHGDLHLGQVLFTGSDFVIIDFEGEPARPINERRFKRGALRDAMGMMRSFSYATEAVLRSGRVRQEDVARLLPWADAWTTWMRATYLRAYLEALGPSPLLPQSDESRQLLLEFYEIEKAIYEVEYELNNRPEWLRIPLTGLANIIAAAR